MAYCEQTPDLVVDSTDYDTLAVAPDANRTFTHPAEDNELKYLTLEAGSYTFRTDADPNGYYWVEWYTSYSGGSPVETEHLYYYDDRDFSFNSTSTTYWVRAELYASDFWGNWNGWVASYRWNVTAYIPKPDLIVQDISISPSSPTATESATITATLKNQGDADASGSIRLMYYVDGGYIGDDYLSFGLGEGDSNTESISYTASSAGSHTVKVVVDTQNSVSESNEGNNERSETYTWKSPPMPDLIVQDISISPSSPTATETATITATLKNQGDASASGSIRLRYYVDGGYIGDDYLSFGLGSGQSDTESISYTVNTEGNHTVRVIIDSENIVIESNENNNDRSETYYWSPPPTPDLDVLSVVLDENASVWYVGDDIDAETTVKNIGTKTADGCKVEYYLGTASNKTYRYIGYGDLASINGMQPGEQESDWIGSAITGGGWTIPDDVTPATGYYIWVHATTTTSGDPNTSNDWEKSTAFAIDVRVPDLDVLSVVLDESVSVWYVGDDIDAETTVKNIGTETADGCKVEYYLGTATNKTYRYIGYRNLASINGMQPGEQESDWIGSAIVGGGWTIPGDVTPGAGYYIWVHATTTSDDANSSNDWEKSSAFTIDVRVPDLDVLSVVLDENAGVWYIGDDIDAQTTVKNIGTETADGCKVEYYLGTATNKTYRYIGYGDLASTNGMQPGEQESDWIGSAIPGGGWTIPEDVTPGTGYYIWVHATTTSSDANSSNDWEKSTAFEVARVFSPSLSDVRITNKVDEDGDGHAQQFTLEVDIFSEMAGEASIALFEDDISIFGFGDDPMLPGGDYPSTTFAVTAGTHTHSWIISVDSYPALERRGTAEFRLDLNYSNVEGDQTQSWAQNDDPDLGNVKVERSYHEKTLADEFSSQYEQIVANGVDWWYQTFGGKPVFGLSVGANADLADLGGLLGNAAAPVVSNLLGALSIDVGAGIDAYFDIADILRATQDGQDGWVSVWLGGHVAGALGFDLPYLGAGSVEISCGISTFDVLTIEEDPVWTPGSGAEFSVTALSATVAGNSWYAAQFGASTDNGWEGDWLGADLGNFSGAFGIDLLDVTASMNLFCFDVRASVLRNALAPVGIGVSAVLFDLLAEEGALIDGSEGEPGYADILLAGTENNYDQEWIRPIDADTPEPAFETEVGAAVFRNGVIGFGDAMSAWHAGVYWFYDGYERQHRVIQANGPDLLLSTVSWDAFLGEDNKYMGTRTHVGTAGELDQATQENIVSDALYQVNAEYTLAPIPTFPANSPNLAWQALSGGVVDSALQGAFRCDQFVEYVYTNTFGSELNPGSPFYETPRDAFYGDNADPVLVTLPTVVEANLISESSVAISFSELMSAGTVDPTVCNTVSLVGSDGGSYSFTAQMLSDVSDSRLFEYGNRRHDVKTLILVADRDFTPGEVLTLSVTEAATDLAGNALAERFETSLPVEALEPAEIEVGCDGTLVGLGSGPIDVGSIEYLSGPLVVTYEIQNVGEEVLQVGEVTLQENSGFSVTQQPSDSVVPGGATYFSIQMDDTLVASASAKVQFSNSDSDESPFFFFVSGEVVEPPFPEITVLEVLNGDTTPSQQENTDFGVAVQAGVAPERTFTVRNDGSAPLELGVVTVSGNYTVTQQLTTVLMPGASDTFTVRMDTTFVGTQLGEILLPNSDSDENPYSFAVAGEVVANPVVAFDLDGNGSIGTGDYSLFSAAWRSTSGDVNWDERCDFDGNGTIGSGDYSLFSPHWRETVPTSSVSSMVLNAADSASSSVDVELVLVSAISGSDEAGTLPADVSEVQTGDTFYVEVWAKNIDGSANGITGGYLDIGFDASMLTGMALNHGGLYTVFPDGSIDNATGLIDDLGGNASPGVIDKGDDEWVRLGYVEFTGDMSGTATFTSAAGVDQIARAGEGGVDWTNVELNSPETSVTIVEPTTGPSVDVELVVVSAISGSDEAGTLPAGVSEVQTGDTFYVEVWAKNIDGSANGITGGYLDIGFDASMLTGMALNHGGLYTVFPDGSIDNATGLIDDLGGNASPGVIDKGDDEWVRLGYVEFTGDMSGTATFTSAAGVDQIARAGEGGVDWTNVELNSPETVEVTIVNSAGVTVTPTSGLITTEAGATTTFSVCLTSQPSSNVVIAVSSSNTAEGTVSPAELTFTPSNWGEPQVVTVTGIDDSVDDGDVAYVIATAAAVSSDPNYHGLDVPDVAITNEDDDTFDFVDLGIVDFRQLDDLSPGAGELWFRLVTAHDGWLTAQSVSEWSQDQLTLCLYKEADLEMPLAESNALDALPRIDYAAEQDQVYFVNVTGSGTNIDLLLGNLVHEQGSVVTVFGTEQGDEFTFDAGASRHVTINGLTYYYDDFPVSEVTFAGNEGRDTAFFYDSSGNEVVEAWPDHATMSNDNGDMEPDYIVTATGIEVLLAYAKRGGDDSAVFHGSDGADKFKSYEDSVRLRAKNSTFNLRAKLFDSVVGDGGYGGDDLAVFNGSNVSESFTCSGADNSSRLQGNDRDHQAVDFPSVVVRAEGGEHDVASFTDVPNMNNIFYFKGHKTVLVTDTLKVTARAFDEVHATADSSGFDVARLYDTAGDEHLEVVDETARLYQRIDSELNLVYEAIGFDRVKVYRDSGNDTTDIGDHTLDLLLYGWDT